MQRQGRVLLCVMPPCGCPRVLMDIFGVMGSGARGQSVRRLGWCAGSGAGGVRVARTCIGVSSGGWSKAATERMCSAGKGTRCPAEYRADHDVSLSRHLRVDRDTGAAVLPGLLVAPRVRGTWTCTAARSQPGGEHPRREMVAQGASDPAGARRDVLQAVGRPEVADVRGSTVPVAGGTVRAQHSTAQHGRAEQGRARQGATARHGTAAKGWNAVLTPGDDPGRRRGTDGRSPVPAVLPARRDDPHNRPRPATAVRPLGGALMLVGPGRNTCR